jgi:hypothetical protein
VVHISYKVGIQQELIIQHIQDLQQKYQVPNQHVAIDAVGIGEHIANSVQLRGVYPFKSSNSAMPTSQSPTLLRAKSNPIIDNRYSSNEFNNLRSQTAWYLAEQIKKRDFKISVSPETIFKEKEKEFTLRELVEMELSVLRDKNENFDDKKRVLISKKEMKEYLGGRSPNLLDTFTMRAIFDLKGQFTDLTKPTKPLQERRFFSKMRNRKFV